MLEPRRLSRVRLLSDERTIVPGKKADIQEWLSTVDEFKKEWRNSENLRSPSDRPEKLPQTIYRTLERLDSGVDTDTSGRSAATLKRQHTQTTLFNVDTSDESQSRTERTLKRQTTQTTLLNGDTSNERQSRSERALKRQVTQTTLLNGDTSNERQRRAEMTLKTQTTQTTMLNGDTSGERQSRTERTLKRQATQTTLLNGDTSNERQSRSERALKRQVTQTTLLNADTSDERQSRAERALKRQATQTTLLNADTSDERQSRTERALKRQVTQTTLLNADTSDERQSRAEMILKTQTTQTTLLNLDMRDERQGITEKTREYRPSLSSTARSTARMRTFMKVDIPQTVRVYRKVCRKLNILPMRRILGQFGRPRIILNNLCLSTADVKAACRALMHETSAAYIDFSGNALGAMECGIVLHMLATNHTFTQVRLADNTICSAGMLSMIKYCHGYKVIRELDISGNRLTDRDGIAIAEIITISPQLRVLHAHHNEFRDVAGKEIGKAIGGTCFLEELDLSWNHIRQHGAIGIARGIEKNISLDFINLGWNGFGFEGCVALSDALMRNTYLEKLDISCNRIHPPALMELMKGLFCNKVLKVLIMDRNPLTPSFTSVFLEGIKRSHHTMALEALSLQGVVVDRDFQAILESIQQEREFRVEYETSLPVSCRKRSEMMDEIEMRNNYNIEPLRMLYLLKERNRAQDFFHKINKDHDDGLTPDELSLLFKESGIPVSRFVIERIMHFMDTDNDGKIDLGEFLVGDKKMKKISRDHARNSIRDETQYSRYSRTFRKAHIQQLTSRLKVDESNGQNYLSPIVSVTPSPASSRRSSMNYP